MSKNGMAGQGKNPYVSLAHSPTPKTEHIVTFENLSGGLNLYELPYRMSSRYSPEMKNMRWKDGALGCRPGQVWAIEDGPGVGYATYDDLFWEYAFFHIGDKLYCADLNAETPAYVPLYDGLPENRGTFFRYRDFLFYKNRGAYVQVVYHADGTTPETMFTAASVHPYEPITYINMDPETHAGDAYQPTNRLTRAQSLWYSAKAGVTVYSLPFAIEPDSINIEGYTKGTDYSLGAGNKSVIFTSAPPVPNPFFANTVKMHVVAAADQSSDDAYHSVMDCPYAIVFGGGQNVCVVLGGCSAQPNAYFWNGNGAAMDAGYFPMPQYNLAGDTEEAITGFGKQQNMLVIFKSHSVGRALLGQDTLNLPNLEVQRVMLTMDYTAINAKIGCDLPWSIQLVENNLVFCNTEMGVHLLKDSSAAYENNIVCLTKLVNGSHAKPGLLNDVRSADVNAVCSFDDEKQYWLVANGHAYVWDYEVSNYEAPSWFFYTNIHAVAFILHLPRAWHLNAEGKVTVLSEQVFFDYGEGIEKVYTFATQLFGNYDRLKDVKYVVFVVRSDTDADTKVIYRTDYEDREDLTNIKNYLGYHLVPRNLEYRDLSVPDFALIARRQPGCRNIRHFTMTLENSNPGQDLSVLSAQIFYKLQGRDR